MNFARCVLILLHNFRFRHTGRTLHWIEIGGANKYFILFYLFVALLNITPKIKIDCVMSAFTQIHTIPELGGSTEFVC